MANMGSNFAMNDYCVYVHTNKINGFRYVGITQQKPEVRWQKGKGYQKQTVFWNAIKKYGWDGFEHEVVASGLTPEEAWRLEQKLIAEYNSTDRNHGYNRSVGGESGAKGVEKNEKQRKAASIALKRQWKSQEFRERTIKRLLATCQTEEAKKKRAESRKGFKFSDETKRKMSKNRKGVKPPPFTPEHIQHIKDHHAGGADKRPVLCVEQNITYESINEASRATGINKKGISGCCRRVEHYITAGGYHWQYA